MKKIVVTIVCLLVFINPGLPQDLKVGVAYRVITPEPLLPVSGGVGIPKESLEKKGDLFARAAVFEEGDERVAIVVVDNLGWPAALGNRSRQLIKGIKPENVLIAATHTHSAPDAYAFTDEKGNHKADLEYLDWCVKQIADAVNEALGSLQPAALKVAMGKTQGKIAYNYYAPMLYDPRCGVIQAVSKQDTTNTILTLVNYAIHPEVIGSSRGILSPDLCGPLYSRIEEKSGGMAMFVNGALGGMVTADNRREEGQEANDWAECQRIGNLLADEALRIVKDAPVLEKAKVYVTSKTIALPVESEMMKFILTNSPLQHARSGTDSVPTQLNLINLGPAQMVTIPGEALPNIGYYLKRKMKTAYPFLLGLCNDAFGYLLTEIDFDSFKRYEYITRTSLGEMAGEVYIKEILTLVEESPRAK
ncbi:hypothetical protein [Negadavirga shengliensis]|uniref:Neutral/alkaline non-lysosomal ceramidase N-terminal domain-containing protein n=1 Tax=Negadavirga shengliensis TaxID=1389218 RepID=A0ABV9T0D4_9BACT